MSMNRNFLILTRPGLMKRLFFSILMGVVLAHEAVATINTYTNNGNFIVPPRTPPQVDATNFLNNGLFSMDLVSYEFQTSGGIVSPEALYDFSSVRNFTNRNKMFANPGFRFDTEPVSVGSRYRANFFVNAGLVPPAFSNASIVTVQHISIDATNVQNRGLLQTGNRGLIEIRGNGLDLTRGAIVVESFGNLTNGAGTLPTDSPSANDGIVSLYWGITNGRAGGVAANQIVPANFPPPSGATLPYGAGFGASNSVHYYNVVSNGYPVSNSVSWYYTLQVQRNPYTIFDAQFRYGDNVGLVATQWVNTVINATSTNRSVQVVYVRNPDTNISVLIGCSLPTAPAQPGVISVAFNSTGVNALNQSVTNGFLLVDTLGSVQTNKQVSPYYSQLGGTPFQPVYQPTNFTITRTTGSYALANNSAIQKPFTSSAIFAGTNPAPVTNFNTAAYGVQLTTTNVQLRYGPEQSYNTLPGRVEITADKSLDLTLSRIDSLSYLSINSTNHFVGSSNANISCPFVDLALGSTNGSLVVPRMFASTIPRLCGLVDVYSVVWTNFLFVNNTTTLTSAASTEKTNATPVVFNVVMVDAHLQTTSPPPQTLTLWLRSTNTSGPNQPGDITIGDTYNVVSNLFIESASLNLLASAQLNFSMSELTWAGQAPYLQTLTNAGVINNAGFGDLNSLGGEGLYFISHDRATGAEIPYASFVNQDTGSILSIGGIIVQANYMENAGIIWATNGPVFISGTNVNLDANGAEISESGDISINAGSLFVGDGHFISAARALSFSVTNDLNTGDNAWYVGDGLNLLIKPATGDFLGTDMYLPAFDYAQVDSIWAGQDFGATFAGFFDNAGLFDLELDGGLNSQFHFIGATGNNAIYTEFLDLLDSTTELDADGNVVQLNIEPGMKIYYGSAFMDTTTDVSAQLDGKNNGRLVWLNGASQIAATVMAKTLAKKHGFLKPRNVLKSRSFVAQATTGAPFSSKDVDLRMSPYDGATKTVTVSWNTPANATSLIYVKPLGTRNWTLLTSHISSSQAGRVSLQGTPASTSLLYRVLINPVR